MPVHPNINDPFSVNSKLKTSSTSIDPGQPAQKGSKLLFQVNFLHNKEPYYIIIYLVVKIDCRMSTEKACMNPGPANKIIQTL